MKLNGQDYHSLWEEGEIVRIIDQRWLPHELRMENLSHSRDFATAIRDMHVRGAPLIGATAAFGMVAACREALLSEDPPGYLDEATRRLQHTRPTAVDLFHAVGRIRKVLEEAAPSTWPEVALVIARAVVSESIAQCKAIGEHGLSLIEQVARKKGDEPVNVLTHCNAGWLACLDYGTATAPIYLAHDRGIQVHVWVDETRPRNQGARITAFELGQHGVPHTVIADNAGGHLMQRGMVDLAIVGTDRTARNGDVANKIGTYLKALAAHDNGVPFYVALPGSSIDWNTRDGLREIPIEERDGREVTHIQGLDGDQIRQVQLTPSGSRAVNYGFDVTPARLVTGLITEKGICQASEAGLLNLYPERRTQPTQ